MDVIAHRERARNGVVWWEWRGFGLWTRNTRLRVVQPYDPKPRLRVGRYRVALLRTKPKVRRG